MGEPKHCFTYFFSILVAASLPLASLVLGNKTSGGCEFPAIFNFGDSNSDTGGLSAVFGQAPPPHGESYFHSPAGRYCDGRLVIDFIGNLFFITTINDRALNNNNINILKISIINLLLLPEKQWIFLFLFFVRTRNVRWKHMLNNIMWMRVVEKWQSRDMKTLFVESRHSRLYTRKTHGLDLKSNLCLQVVSLLNTIVLIGLQQPKTCMTSKSKVGP